MFSKKQAKTLSLIFSIKRPLKNLKLSAHIHTESTDLNHSSRDTIPFIQVFLLQEQRIFHGILFRVEPWLLHFSCERGLPVGGGGGGG